MDAMDPKRLPIIFESSKLIRIKQNSSSHPFEFYPGEGDVGAQRA